MTSLEQIRRREERIIQAIKSGFWYSRPGEDGYISWRLHHLNAMSHNDSCIGEYSNKRELESAMLRRHKAGEFSKEKNHQPVERG